MDHIINHIIFFLFHANLNYMNNYMDNSWAFG